MRSTVTLSLALVVLALCLASVVPAGRGSGVGADAIAYLRYARGTPQIYRYQLTTRRLERLSKPPIISVATFSFAPDGRQFVCDCIVRGISGGLVIVNRAGSVHVLTHGTADFSPRWSPDGKWIVFARLRDAKHFTTGDLYLVRSDGSDLKRLTTTVGADLDPAWAPDSTRIAFRNGGLNVVRADDHGLRRLGLRGIQPAWSPDGTELAYALPGRRGESTIKVSRVDGSGTRSLTDGGSHDLSPAWSRDGSQVFYESTRSDRGDIYVASADGASIDRVTASVDRETSPAVVR